MTHDSLSLNMFSTLRTLLLPFYVTIAWALQLFIARPLFRLRLNRMCPLLLFDHISLC